MTTTIANKSEPAGYVHERTKNVFYERIRTGLWSPNSKIPGENDLVKEFKVSRGTIRKALKSLEDDGMLVTEHGSGRTILSQTKKSVNAKKVIGIIMHHLNSTDGDIDAIKNTANIRGYDINIYLASDRMSALSRVSSKDVSGLLMYCQEVSNDDISKFSKYLPTVSVLHNCVKDQIPSYYLDWSLITFDVASYLADTGFLNQILIIPSEPAWEHWNSRMIAGFKYSCNKHGIQFDLKNILKAPFAYQAIDIASLINTVAQRVDSKNKIACFSTISWVCIEILKWATENNIAVPNMLSVAALHGTEELNKSPIPVTAYSFALNQVTTDATNHLIDIIEGKSLSTPIDNMILGKLLCHQSTRN